MESTLKELMVLCCLLSLDSLLKADFERGPSFELSNRHKRPHEERIKILQQLSALQVEKDNLLWRKRELNVKNDIADRSWKRRQENQEEKKSLKNLKPWVSSFPEEMGTMQGQLRKYKEAASDFILDRLMCSLFPAFLIRRSTDQVAEIQKLNAVYKLDGRACTPKWNWMRCKKNWQLMS
ncbi:unnamed protein product [Prunus armeniaca]|uniref:Uncharacterized protein n=1 Tax=Prunus armeniaca TaxID=36596 RepID=A0A6J5U0B9_PRUAR|nr:unnamed protein product [Prunus armeniaca]